VNHKNIYIHSRRNFIKKILGSGLAATAAYFTASIDNNVYAIKNNKPIQSVEVRPGELDEYYGFWSGGHSGEVRVLGIPSMREIKRIPVFNYDCTYGWGITNFSKKLLGKYTVGDTHHTHLSYHDGTYDGKYLFCNDKSQGRLARIRLDVMETDSIINIPNSQGTHGIFPSRHKLNAIYCNSEFRIPYPNDGRNLTEPKKYVSLHTAVDAKTMKVRWQVMVDGNLDLCAADYKGKYSMGTCYNSEGGVTLAEMMASDRDHLSIFNLNKIEKAVKEGRGNKLTGEDVPVINGRGKNKYVSYVPIPKNPHGVNIDPTGTYIICCGKLSPTISIIPLTNIDKLFDGDIKDPRKCVIAEPEVGLGPLHTAFDNKGNAYTAIFIDSVITKWNIKKAAAGLDCIVQKLDVCYQPGHINASMSETKDADGKYIFSLNKFSKDRFLPVGPYYPENDQLISIERGKMELLHDSPAHPEPHDAIIVKRSIIRASKIWNPKDRKFNWEKRLVKSINSEIGKNEVIRKGNKIYAIMNSIAPSYGLTEIHAKLGDEVTIVQTNLDKVADLTHGFCLSKHNILFGVSPMETASVTFTANKKGVFWYYCPWFCHALHLEMRGRFIVS
jgi:nitrous-oxide reductase